MKLTRRQLATAVVSATAIAQTRTPANPPDDLQTARDRIKANSDALAQQQIPMATEPAFQFKA
jgi:hypothetical protein